MDNLFNFQKFFKWNKTCISATGKKHAKTLLHAVPNNSIIMPLLVSLQQIVVFHLSQTIIVAIAKLHKNIKYEGLHFIPNILESIYRCSKF